VILQPFQHLTILLRLPQVRGEQTHLLERRVGIDHWGAVLRVRTKAQPIGYFVVDLLHEKGGVVLSN